MSKYLKGPYHFVEFSNPNTTYAKHVDDLLKQLEKHIGADPDLCVYEVGCGEGLILMRIHLELGWLCGGSEIDEHAVAMFKRFHIECYVDKQSKPAEIPTDGWKRHVALFSDSLEHVEDPIAMIEWAKDASWIVIATPSEHDRHAVRQPKIDDFDPLLSEWGDIAHRATRHARHLTIWKRK